MTNHALLNASRIHVLVPAIPQFSGLMPEILAKAPNLPCRMSAKPHDGQNSMGQNHPALQVKSNSGVSCSTLFGDSSTTFLSIGHGVMWQSGVRFRGLGLTTRRLSFGAILHVAFVGHVWLEFKLRLRACWIKGYCTEGDTTVHEEVQSQW